MLQFILLQHLYYFIAHETTPLGLSRNYYNSPISMLATAVFKSRRKDANYLFI